MKFRTVIIFLTLAAAVVAALYWQGMLGRSQAPGGTAAVERGGPGVGAGRRGAGARRDRVTPVLAEPVRVADVPVYLDGVGTVRAFKTVTIKPQVSGRLVSINFREGQDVRKGDLLARIDSAIYKAALDQAVARKAMDEANLANARRDLERYSGLARSDFASKQQADTQRAAVAQAEAQVKQDQAAIDSAQANLDYTTILAPIDGRTGIRQVDEGNLVSSGDTDGLVVITQLQPISVVFTLPETVVAEVAAAARPVRLIASVGTQTLDQGVLEVIDNQIDQATGTIRIKGTFENQASRLWPGQFVNVRLLLKTIDDALVVPSAAVQQGNVGSYVYVVQDDDTVKLTPVQITQQDETQAVIANGIERGDRIVTSGFAALQDGAHVSISSPDAPQAGAPPVSRRRRASAAEPAANP